MSTTEAQKVVEKEEIEELFNVDFLPKIKKIITKLKNSIPDENVKYFETHLIFRWKEEDGDLTVSSLVEKNNVKFSITPITQEALDKIKKENESQNKNEVSS